MIHMNLTLEHVIYSFYVHRLTGHRATLIASLFWFVFEGNFFRVRYLYLDLFSNLWEFCYWSRLFDFGMEMTLGEGDDEECYDLLALSKFVFGFVFLNFLGWVVVLLMWFVFLSLICLCSSGLCVLLCYSIGLAFLLFVVKVALCSWCVIWHAWL